ncbi:unnamed protein product [Amoebophrya sp. A25]|nr:unnamed protein product [Amoebophrya sp. A25]|eukprot:GSA25T00024324001.1
MDANGDVAPPGSPPGEEFPGLRITANSAASSSTDPLWCHTTNQDSGTDVCAIPLFWTDGQQAATHSCSSGRRPRLVSDRPRAANTRLTGRRIGSAVVCFEAVSALHRKYKGQRGAKTLAQVFSGKGKNTSASPAPAEEAYGPAAEFTSKTAAQAQGFSAGDDDRRTKRSEGKRSPDSGITTAAEVNGIGNADPPQKPQGSDGSRTISSERTGSSQGSGKEHAKGAAAEPGPNNGVVAQEHARQRAASEDRSQAQNHEGVSTSARAHSTEGTNKVHDEQERAASTLPTAEKGMSAEEYPQGSLSEDKKTKLTAETANSIDHGSDKQLRESGKKGMKNAKTASPANKPAAASQSQRATRAIGRDAEDSRGVTSVGVIDDAASLAEYGEGLDCWAGIATVTHTTTALKMKMLRRSSCSPPSLFGRVKAWGRQVVNELYLVRRRVAGIFWSSSPAEDDAIESGPLDIDARLLWRGEEQEDAQELSLLQLQIEGFRFYLTRPKVADAINEVPCEHTVAQEKNAKPVLNAVEVTPSSPLGRSLHELYVSTNALSFFCECAYENEEWQFELGDPNGTPGGISTAGDSSDATSLTTEPGTTQSPVCRIYAVEKVQLRENDGAQNDGALLVLVAQKIHAADGASPTRSSSTDAATSRRLLFCKKMKADSVDENGKESSLKNDNRSECKAASHFVTMWNENILAHGGYKSSVVGIPFCIEELSKEIDPKEHHTLCSDAMDSVNDAKLTDALAAAGKAPAPAANRPKEEDGPRNIVWWTWNSIGGLVRAGLFHRDIKSTNFVSRGEGAQAVWIAIDMGFACGFPNGSPGVRACASVQQIAGTLDHLSPDHVKFNSGRERRSISVDDGARGDSFSWAVDIIQTKKARASRAVLALLGFKSGKPFPSPTGNQKSDQLEKAKFEEDRRTAVVEMLRKRQACRGSILLRMASVTFSSEQTPAGQSGMSKAVELLSDWIDQNTELGPKTREALEKTRLTPLPHSSLVDEPSGPIPAIELIAQALLGNPWSLSYREGKYANKKAASNQFYMWQETTLFETTRLRSWVWGSNNGGYQYNYCQ